MECDDLVSTEDICNQEHVKLLCCKCGQLKEVRLARVIVGNPYGWNEMNDKTEYATTLCHDCYEDLYQTIKQVSSLFNVKEVDDPYCMVEGESR